MKQKYLILTLAFLSAVLSGCRRDEPASGTGEAAMQITLSLPGTRAAGDMVADTPSESALNRVDIFVYAHSGGRLLNSLSVTPAEVDDITSLELIVMNVPADVFVVANAPDGLQSQGATRTSLLAAVSAFTDNSAASFVMTGSVYNVDPSAGSPVAVQLTRVASKVILHSVKKDFAIASAQASTVTLTDVRLVNVRKVVTLFDAIDAAPAASDANYINPRSFVETGTGMVGASGLSYVISGSGTALGDGIALYFYPNAATETATVTGEDYVTKLVLTVDIGGTAYRYPIGLPQNPSRSGRNLVYDIPSVTLNLLGNPETESPNRYLYERSAEVALNILDWDEMSIEPLYADEKAEFIVTGPDAFTTLTGMKTITIASRTSNMLGQVRPLGWTFMISFDAGANWSPVFPFWMSPSATSGSGTVSGTETVTLSYDKSAMALAGVSSSDIAFRFIQTETGKKKTISMTEE